MERRNIGTEMFPSFYWKVIHLLFLRLVDTNRTATTKQMNIFSLLTEHSCYETLWGTVDTDPVRLLLTLFLVYISPHQPTSLQTTHLCGDALVFSCSEQQSSCHLYSNMLNPSHKVMFILNSASSPLASGKTQIGKGMKPMQMWWAAVDFLILSLISKEMLTCYWCLLFSY